MISIIFFLCILNICEHTQMFLRVDVVIVCSRRTVGKRVPFCVYVLRTNLQETQRAVAF